MTAHGAMYITPEIGAGFYENEEKNGKEEERQIFNSLSRMKKDPGRVVLPYFRTSDNVFCLTSYLLL